MTEIARSGLGKPLGPGHSGEHPSHVGYDTASPEGTELFSSMHGVVLTIFQLDNVSNATTGLRLWQAETDTSGISWTAPHPFVIPGLHADNVTDGTHMAPGNGIELQHGPCAGRLLAVLILAAPDVVVYSDDGGESWQLSDTPLPGGEAQLAELRTPDGRTAVIFNSRLKSPHKRGVAWSRDCGRSFTDIREADDLTGGTSCDSSIISLDQHPVRDAAVANGSSLLFSHPSGKDRTHKAGRNGGVLLQSNDYAETWREVGSATPEDESAKFGYSNLNQLPAEASDTLTVGLTYETEAEGCDPALESSACTIIYRTFEFAALAAKTDDSEVQQSPTNSRADPMETAARELQRRIDEAVTAGAPSLSVAGGEYNVRPAPSADHATG